MKFQIAFAFLAQAVSTATVIAEPKDCSNTDKWDVIVVGAGLSGSIMAAELANATPDKCVLVVEGGNDSGQILDKQDIDADTSYEEFFEKGWETVYNHETLFNTPGTYNKMVCWDRSCDYVWGGADGSNTPNGLIAGKLVGGSGALNGALMQYPPDRNWDVYPGGWKARDMKKYLDEIHKTMNASGTPSADGKHYNDEYGSDLVKEAMKNQGFIEMEDAAYWRPSANTMDIPKVTTDDMGRRASSTSVYLKPALKKANIELVTKTEVIKINLDQSKTKATGLKVRRNGIEQDDIVLAEDGLLVVSGGGVKTPQLLLESGIGPGMEVDNEFVGEGLTDKPMMWYKFDVPGMEKYDIASPLQDHQNIFVGEGSGPLTQFGPLLVGMIDPKIVGQEENNMVEFFVQPTVTENEVRVDFVHLTPKKVGDGATIFKDSNGRYNVKGDQWDTAYSRTSIDAAIDVVKKAMKTKDIEPKKPENDQRSDDNPGGYPNVNNMNHPGGTCGLDKCIDSKTLLVKGLKNVAVCDNSIVLEQAIVHTALSLMAMALRGADILKDFWGEVRPTQLNDEL